MLGALLASLDAKRAAAGDPVRPPAPAPAPPPPGTAGGAGGGAAAGGAFAVDAVDASMPWVHPFDLGRGATGG